MLTFERYFRVILWVILLLTMLGCDYAEPSKVVGNVLVLGTCAVVVVDFLNEHFDWASIIESRIAISISLYAMVISVSTMV